MKIREKYPTASIAISNRHSSHQKYNVEERRDVLKFLDRIRNENVVEKHG